MARAKKKTDSGNGQPTGYFARTRTLSLSLLYILPLLLVYEVGLLVLQPDLANAAGVFMKVVLAQLGDPWIFNIIVIIAVAIAWARTSRSGGVEPGYLVGVTIESLLWAVIMMVFAVVFTNLASESLPRLATGGSIPEGMDTQLYAVLVRIVHACGAGVYEELLFRQFLLVFLCWLAVKLFAHEEREGSKRAAMIVGIMASSVLFALAHHIPPQPAPSLEPMVFRTVCGFFLGVLFMMRGLAVAVYAHTAYDLYVFLILRPPGA